MSPELRRAALLVGVASALWWPAQQLLGFELYEQHRATQHLRHVATSTGSWRLGSVGTLLCAVGLVAGAGLMVLRLASGRWRVLGLTGLGLFGIGWVLEDFVRLTYTATQADRVVTGEAAPSGFPGTWGVETSPVTVVAGFGLLAALLVLVTLLRRQHLVHPVLGWICTVTALSALSTDPTIPLTLSMLPIAVGVVVTGRAHRRAPVLSPG